MPESHRRAVPAPAAGCLTWHRAVLGRSKTTHVCCLLDPCGAALSQGGLQKRLDTCATAPRSPGAVVPLSLLMSSGRWAMPSEPAALLQSIPPVVPTSSAVPTAGASATDSGNVTASLTAMTTRTRRPRTHAAPAQVPAGTTAGDWGCLTASH